MGGHNSKGRPRQLRTDVLPIPWPVTGSLIAGIGSLTLTAALLGHRGKPGVDWFLLTLLLQTIWCFCYGVSLLVFDPTLRWLFEVLTWMAIVWTGVPFLAFALEYTGRGTLIRTKWFGIVGLLPAITTVLVVTNPMHGLVWSGFHLDPVFGAATVSYEFGPWAYVAIMTASVFVALGTFLLFDTVVSYGPLYRTEALAVGVSTLPPGIALLAWLVGLGPVPQLNLATVMFLPHVLLDAYAFAGSNMFAFSPSTRRTADRSAIEDLENPFLVIDNNERIVDVNPKAAETFDVGQPDILGTDLGEATGLKIDVWADNQVITDNEHGRYRELAVSTSPLREPSGTLVGHTVFLQEITEQRRRKQQLDVLNRILRHNLRNDLNVVDGYVGLAIDRSDDDDVVDLLENVHTDVTGILSMAENASVFERALESLDEPPSCISLQSVVQSVSDDVEIATGGEVEVDVPDGIDLVTRRELLVPLFENLAENGIQHVDGDRPTVRITLEGVEDDAAIVTVSDEGTGIPEHELAVLEEAEETSLEHGSGLGLWIVIWCVQTLGGTISFDTSEGTTATIRLPGVCNRRETEPATTVQNAAYQQDSHSAR